MAKPTKGRSRRPPNTQAKEGIIQAAIRCFVREGIGAVRAVDIAREAKVSPPLFAHYYSDIHLLYADVIMEVLKGLREMSIEAIRAGGDSPKLAMGHYIEAPFKWASSHRDLFSLWMCFYYMASFSEAFEVISREIREQGRERISMLIYRGIEAGHFKLAPGETVTEVAWTLQALISGGAILAGTEGRKHDDWSEYQKTTREACMKLLGCD